MIRTQETGYAVCLGALDESGTASNDCFWTASGPMSVQAALAHDIEHGDHYIKVGSRS